MQIATFVVGFIAYAWLALVVQRHGARKHLPSFTFYVVWECLITLIQLALWLADSKVYYRAYWWIEAFDVAFIVAAVRESFLRLFHPLTKRADFRGLVWGLIGAVVIYSAWKAVYAPPLQSGRLNAFVFGAEFLFRWGIFGIAALTGVLSLLLEGTIKTREAAVVVGFGIASLAFVLYVGSFSVFGSKYTFLTKYLPSVGYFLAVGWWIWVFSRSIEKLGFKELGAGPEEMRRHLLRFGEHVDEMRKKW